jgi:3-hydroxyacyl-[acyl-carrier-protein] dehydratase
MDSAAVGALLAHRFPFLLVDRIEIAEPGQRVVGFKRVTGNEWWGESAPQVDAGLPFCLVLEAMAQTSGALIRDLADGAEGAIAYFMGLSRVRLRRAARPGDELAMEVSLRLWRRGLCRTRAVARVGGALVASAELTTIVRVAAPPAEGR